MAPVIGEGKFIGWFRGLAEPAQICFTYSNATEAVVFARQGNAYGGGSGTWHNWGVLDGSAGEFCTDSEWTIQELAQQAGLSTLQARTVHSIEVQLRNNGQTGNGQVSDNQEFGFSFGTWSTAPVLSGGTDWGEIDDLLDTVELCYTRSQAMGCLGYARLDENLWFRSEEPYTDNGNGQEYCSNPQPTLSDLLALHWCQGCTHQEIVDALTEGDHVLQLQLRRGETAVDWSEVIYFPFTYVGVPWVNPEVPSDSASPEPAEPEATQPAEPEATLPPNPDEATKSPIPVDRSPAATAKQDEQPGGNPGSPRLKTGAIIGIVVAVIVALALCCIIFVFCYKKKAAEEAGQAGGALVNQAV